MEISDASMQQAIHMDDWDVISRGLARAGTGIIIKSSLTVRDFMRPNPWVLTVEDSLAAVGDIIINKGIDAVPIVDRKGMLVGLVSKTLLLREMLSGRGANSPVRDYMIRNPITVHPDENVSVLITVNIGNLPVVEEGRLVGIVTLSDTIRAYFSALMAVREELNTILDAAHNGIITVDESGCIAIMNQAAANFLQIRREEAVGQTMDNLFGENFMKRVMQSGQAVLGQKLRYQGRRFISNMTPISSGGAIIGAVAVFQDISDLESISEELLTTRRMKDELDAIIESSYDGVAISDEKGRNIRVNGAFARIMGVEREEAAGRIEAEWIAEGIYARPVVGQVLQNRQAVTITQERAPGRSVVITANPVLDQEGQVFRVVTNFRDMSELIMLKQELEQAQTLGQHYQEKLHKYQLGEQYVMRSKQSEDLLDLCIRLGQVDSTVLIQGESGTGKEMVAKIIHSNSSRNARPMVSINCAAIPENLLEAELFGYAPGAFTGAVRSGKAGLFEMADRGTLFLDEVGEMPLILQGKLLRAVQEREIMRLGSTAPVRIDVRLLAATNQDLEAMVRRKEFRQDLYYRLNVIPLTVPPLRERRSEIPFFVAHFLKRFNEKYGFNRSFGQAALDKMMDYPWPGNIRELENLVERLVVTSLSDVIEDLALPGMAAAGEGPGQPESEGRDLKESLERLEKRMIEQALATHGSTRRAAEALGISQPSVVRKAARYRIRIREN